MNKGGRKGYGEELKIKQRFSALSEPFFKVLQDFLNSEDKSDRKFAITELNKGFTKMIPTTIGGEEDGLPIVITIANSIAKKHGIPTSSTGSDSEGHPQV